MPPPRNLRSKFFLWTSAAALTIVFAGFARSYYLHGLFGRPPLPLLLHLHGAVMSSWFALLAVQSILVARGYPRLHRTLGWIGVGLAAIIVSLGLFVAIHAAVRDLPDPKLGSIFFLGADIAMVLLFGGIFAAAVAVRRRSETHKRLVLLATLCILPTAIGRLPGMGAVVPVILGTAAVAMVCAGADAWRHRRLHAVFAWGVPLVVGTLYLAFEAAQSQAWTNLATHLLSSSRNKSWSCTGP
jgi:hypothetical protein